MHAYEGGYSAYVLARAERERVQAATEARRGSNLVRKELAWLRRGPPARTSKPQFRIDAANALIADEPPARDGVELLRFATARLGKTVYDLHDVDAAASATGCCSTGSTWQLGPGDRVGIVGVNGAGKTTLLRLLAGDAAPDGGPGRARQSPCRPAYLSQEVAELDPSLRVLEAVEEVRRGRRPRQRPDDDGAAAARAVRLHRRPRSGRRSATCPAASGGGCSCCGC